MLQNPSYLSNERKFPKLSSITSTPEFQKLKPYIDITESFYDIIEADDFEALYTKFRGIVLNENSESERELFFLRSYVLILLNHIVFVRLKKRRYIVNLFTRLYQEKPDLQQFFLHVSTHVIHSISPFSNVFFSAPDETELNKSYFYTIYEENTLKKFVKDDDVNKLKEFRSKEKDFSSNYYFSLDHSDPINIEFMKSMRVSISLLDFCVFYGSSECFKLLLINKKSFNEYTALLSVSGGNLEIIHLLEQNGLNFDSCFKASINYHRRDLSEWLLSNYKCEFFNLADCISFCDYTALLFLLLNGANPNNELYNKNSQTFLCYTITQGPLNLELLQILIQRGLQINEICKSDRVTALYELCAIEEYFDIGAIKLLISSGADINHGSYTPLYALCAKQKAKREEIDFFLQNGADINAGDKTPLCALFSKPTVDYELADHLLSKGADPNAGFKTPLCILFTKQNHDYDAITYLIQHGADINKEFYFNLRSYTPLNYFCSQSIINLKMLKFLIQMGAKVNQTSKDPMCNEYTPLYALCSHHHTDLEALKLLIENGADVNKGCKLPLYLLCSKQEINKEAIQLLIKSGSKIDSKVMYTTISKPELKQLLKM